MAKNLILWLVIAVVLMSVFQGMNPGTSDQRTYAYSEFVRDVNRGSIREVTINESKRSISGVRSGGEQFRTVMPAQDPDLLNDLLNQSNVTVRYEEPESRSLLGTIFISWFPMLLLIAVWIFFMRQMQGGGGRGAMSFGKSKARLMGEDQVKTTLADVAGCEEAKRRSC